MMCPEWAASGTVTTRPALGRAAIAQRRCAAGDTRLILAPGDLGKATTMPGLRLVPPSSRVPWVETWWGLPLQCAAGVQVTLVMRTLSTCSDGALALALELSSVLLAAEPPVLVVEVPPAACVPPASAAPAGSGYAPSTHSASVTAAAATNLERLRLRLLAKTCNSFAQNHPPAE